MQRVHRLWGVVCFALALLFVAVSAAAEQPHHTGVGRGPLVIRFTLRRDYLMIVRGSIGDKSKLTFLIDTGADHTVIDQHIARELHLQTAPATLSTFDQKLMVECGAVRNIQIGALKADALNVLVRDLSSLQQGLGAHVDAIIGLDVLGVSSFAIDYQSRRIYLGNKQIHTKYSVPLVTGPHELTVLMKLDKQSVRLLVDTGASAVMLFKSHMPDVFPETGPSCAADNLAGRFERFEAKLPVARLGEANFGPLRAFVVYDKEDNGRDFDGLMSVSAMRLKRVSFDLENKTFGWD